MAQTVDELKKLPKDSLVKMAVKKINDPDFDVHDFARIEVWTKRDENEIMVKFDYAIRFIPRRGQYYCNITVDLLSGTIGRQIIGEGPDDEEAHYFKSEGKYRDKIKFVLNSINKSKGVVGKIPEGKLPDGTMTVQEKATHYEVTADSETSHSTYKIKKGSGKVYDANHKHYYSDHSSKQVRIY